MINFILLIFLSFYSHIALSAGKEEDIQYLTDIQLDDILNLSAEKYRQKLMEKGK